MEFWTGNKKRWIYQYEFICWLFVRGVVSSIFQFLLLQDSAVPEIGVSLWKWGYGSCILQSVIVFLGKHFNRIIPVPLY